jgi:hypothetical protein
MSFINDPDDPDVTMLRKLNAAIGKAEKEADASFLRRVLAPDLIFRRASGQVVDRTTYLVDLVAEGNKYNLLELVEPFDVLKFDADKDVNKTAVVSLIIRAEGTRDGSPFSGMFRNHRLFRKGGAEGWQCVVWYNTRIGDLQLGS